MSTILRFTGLGSLVALALLAASGGEGAVAQQRPPNDDFADYRLVALASISPLGAEALDYTDTVDTTGATVEPGEPECLPGDGASVWYLFYPEATTDFLVDTTGSDFATTVGVYRITDFVPSPPGGSLDEVACSGGAGSQAVISFPGRTGSGYAIRIAGVDAATGIVQLRVGCVESCPARNDNIADAPQLYEVPFRDALNTLGATTEPGEPLDCGNIGRTVWYRINVLETGTGHRVSVSTSGSDFASVVAIYEVDFSTNPSPPGTLQLVQCADGGNGTFVTENFTDYLIQVGGRDGAGGNVSVEMLCELPVCPFQGIITPDTGGNATPGPGTGGEGGGTIAPPSTGSGGYRR
jgi:hypothetical protein